MRVRTYLGILLGLLVVVSAAILTQLNKDLLLASFRITRDTEVPFYALLLGVFLTAFLPTATLLLVQSVRRDLEVRRNRRGAREIDSLDRAFQRAVDAQTDGQWAKAVEELEVVLKGRPNEFGALLRYGLCLRQADRPGEALEVHRRAAVLFPQSVAFLYQMALDYEALGEEEVAEELYSRIAREHPHASLQVLSRRRDRALEGERWRSAASLQRQIEELFGKSAIAGTSQERYELGLRYQQGVRRLEEDRGDEAAEIFQGLLDDEPRFIPAAIMLGEAKILVEREAEAVAAWLHGYETSGSPTFLRRIEDHFIEKAQPEQAIETFWSLIGTADNDLLPRFVLGRFYYRLEMHSEALKVLRSIEGRVVSSPTYHYLLARIYERQQDPDRALEEYLAAAQQAGVPEREYACLACGGHYPDWRARCERCGSWNSIEMDFHEERMSPAELGVQEAPVWGAYPVTSTSESS